MRFKQEHPRCFLALTRRAGAELAGLVGEPDPTLVRHLHDLRALREHYDPAEVAMLAREIMGATLRPAAISSRPTGRTQCAKHCRRLPSDAYI